MENVETIEDRKVIYIDLDSILPNRFQPRIKFDEQALNELSDSIKEHGILSPITVRPLGDKYEIIAGERRYKASVLAGLSKIPALVVDIDDKESAEIALIENVQRKDLTPIEEAISYKKIFDMNIGISQEDLAKKLGKSQSTIANKLRLLNLSDEVQEALLESKISERHARSLLRIKDKQKQNELLDKIIKERLTVRKTDEEIIEMMNNKEVEVLDFDFNENSQLENISSPVDKFNNLYNLPTSPIIEDKEDEFIPTIPEVNDFKLPGFNSTETEKPVENSLNLPSFDEITPFKIDNQEDTVPLDELLKKLNESSEDLSPTINPELPTPEIEQSPNPGFLDIDKIENEASDINKNNSKISLEDLLNSTDNKTIEVEEESHEPPVFPQSSRFFTMLDDENSDGESKPAFEPKVTLENKEEKENDFNNHFDLNFTDHLKNEEKENQSFSPLENLEPENQLMGNNLGNIVEDKNESSDEMLFNNFDFNHLNDKEEVFMPSTNIIEEEEIELPNKEETSDITSFETPSFTPVPPLNFDSPDETESVIEDNLSDLTESNFDTKPIDFDTPKTNNQFDYTPVYDEDEEVTMPATSEDLSLTVDNNKYGSDLKTVINTIRTCADTIEKYGYVIDTEEFDFEDMYQVILKIQKKN